MIVHMMVLDNKLLSFVKMIKSSKNIFLLLLFVSILFSCNNKSQTIKKGSSFEEKTKDSIILSVKFTGKGIIDLYYRDNYLNFIPLGFINNSPEKKVIYKSIKRFHDNFILSYKVLVYDNKNFNKIEQRFYVDNDLDTLKLVYNTNKYFFNDNVRNINKLYESYNELNIDNIKIQKDYLLAKKKLDSVFKYNKAIFNFRDIESINKIKFYEYLQKIDATNNKVDSFVKNLKKITGSKVFSSLTYNYTKNRLHLFDYSKLNKKEFSEKYIEILAIGHLQFLKIEDNKGKSKYKEALNWFKNTDLYKKDSLFIKKQIMPINNTKFKKYVKKITLFDVKDNENSIEEIIKKHSSNYYLIDFWATWCAPCIGGVKLMNKMDFPKNVKVISISLDKPKDKKKWKSKTEELKQLYTYWLDEDSTDGKSFLKFIELKSIPRYILIDKNLNLIDQAFYHPSEIQFLSKLKDIQNHKYW